ncbi:bcl-2-related protein A1 [Perognathus longimembris pacificus]|uniref:bcl-2-related protein A1 n=1 Tax=Perognathus longimembris pacificus TaxID=214514 RepID=UPI002019CB69|nr:bcl-2-related protein A1 [Perognathus longimembris pacificus]
MDPEFAQTHGLVRDYLRWVLRASGPAPEPGRAARALRSAAASAQREVERRLPRALAGLRVASPDAARAAFDRVMAREFEDGVLNWGRIVTVLAFSGVLVKKLPAEQRAAGAGADPVSLFVAEFLMRVAGDWMRRNGGWENGFLKKFETKSCWLTFLEVTGQLFEMFSLLKQYY